MSNCSVIGFDAGAPFFEQHRGLPSGVAKAVRFAVLALASAPSRARILDLGAGTGRIGRAFVDAGDDYIGVDLSLGMLRGFSVYTGASRASPLLIQARGERLPFQDSTFSIVILIQLLNGTADWRGILTEVQRLLKPGGTATVGQTIADPNGIEAQLKNRLEDILAEMGIDERRHRKIRAEALAWLQETACHQRRMIAASWTQTRTPRQFLARKVTGHRFALLEPSIREAALAQLSGWAVSMFGSLDKEFPERQSFELNAFQFHS